MSPRPKPHALAPLGLALLPAIVACTLTSDSFVPEPVDTLPLRPTGAVSSPPPAPEVEPSVSCGGELSSCEIERVPDTSCDSDLDCESQVCASGACASPSCTDGRKNGSELDIDCGGGACQGCRVGTGCNEGLDCLTGVCGEAGTCAPASCNDDVRNQDEAGVDCGGVCPACAAAQACATAADCQSGVCGDDGCAAGVERCCQTPSCDDDVRNGNEPVADCGNAACGLCPLGNPCSASAQCTSEFCQAGACRVHPCEDSTQNGSETDTDCGGGGNPRCARCEVGDSCAGNGDCASGSCANGACADCNDGERNGTETGVDCGGVCGLCGPGQTCGADAQCQSGACQDGRCCGGLQLDCTRCARRLVGAINCNSNGPTGAADCGAFLDCLAANPATCPVRHAPGCSEDPGGVCNHTDFGGNSGPGVGLADAIIGSAQCDF